VTYFTLVYVHCQIIYIERIYLDNVQPRWRS